MAWRLGQLKSINKRMEAKLMAVQAGHGILWGMLLGVTVGILFGNMLTGMVIGMVAGLFFDAFRAKPTGA